MSQVISAADILKALQDASSEFIWASELALLGQSRRIDFWTLAPTASQQFRATAYEIKVSRADFRRDSEAKQAGALLFSDRFWYVTPPGMLRREEIPAWAGLQEFDGKSFSIIKRAPKRDRIEPTWEFIVSLLRNCGESRRDVSLLKMQIGFLQHSVDRLERQQKHVHERQMRRWLASATAGRRALESEGQK